MENETNIFLGGTIILLALFVQKKHFWAHTYERLKCWNLEGEGNNLAMLLIYSSVRKRYKENPE